jgi:3-methylcrotonyl-CoA carboxylase beta subunit
MKLESSLSSSDYFKSNYKFNKIKVDELTAVLAKNKQGGGSKSLEREKKKGKLSVRERVNLLIDKGSNFFELSALAAEDVYESPVAGAAIVTGVGKVSGTLCMIVANDQTVKGGTYYPLTVKKHLRAQKIAEKNNLPCLYLVDSGGAFLPKQDEVFPDEQHFGRIFYNQARMSSKGIPQISSVHGFCTAGGAYIPSMSDHSVIVEKTGSIFLAGPPLVKAATGEEISAEDLGGAKVHTKISGVADYLAEDDAHAIYLVREIVKSLSPKKPSFEIKDFSEPLYSQDELLGVVGEELNKPVEIRDVIARIVDSSDFFEFKPGYGSTLVTGFADICGISVGIIANNGILFSESALKGAHFIELCCQQNRPLLFLQNITGFMVGKQYEHEGIAKHGAKLVNAVANAAVPKVTVVVGGSYGAGNYGMCGRAFDPDFLFMWPCAKISVMGGEQAANVLVTVKEQQMRRSGLEFSQPEQQKIRAQILAKYSKESHPFYSSARLWDDGVIDPRDTRKIVSQAFAATLCKTKSETKFGIFRM